MVTFSKFDMASPIEVLWVQNDLASLVNLKKRLIDIPYKHENLTFDQGAVVLQVRG